MSVCSLCGKLTTGAASCMKIRFRIGGKFYDPVPYEKRERTPFEGPQGRCLSCNILPGGFHHVGCTVEKCPKCRDSWIFCRCSGCKIPIEAPKKKECRIIPFSPKAKAR